MDAEETAKLVLEHTPDIPLWVAIQQGLTASHIAHTIHAHPTLAKIMGEVSLKASANRSLIK